MGEKRYGRVWNGNVEKKDIEGWCMVRVAGIEGTFIYPRTQ